jgi:hypothetical protein
MAWSLPSDAIGAAAYEGHTLTHDATSAVEGRHRAGEKSPPDSGDLRGYPDRVPPSPARPGLIDRHDLVAAVDHAAEKKMTIISAPAGSGKTSLLRAWAGRLGQGRRSPSCRCGQASMTRTGLDNHRNPVTASHRPSGEP